MYVVSYSSYGGVCENFPVKLNTREKSRTTIILFMWGGQDRENGRKCLPMLVGYAYIFPSLVNTTVENIDQTIYRYTENDRRSGRRSTPVLARCCFLLTGSNRSLKRSGAVLVRNVNTHRCVILFSSGTGRIICAGDDGMYTYTEITNYC